MLSSLLPELSLNSKPGSLFNLLQLTLGLDILITWSWSVGLSLLMVSSAIESK